MRSHKELEPHDQRVVCLFQELMSTERRQFHTGPILTTGQPKAAQTRPCVNGQMRLVLLCLSISRTSAAHIQSADETEDDQHMNLVFTAVRWLFTHILSKIHLKMNCVS